MDGFFDWLAELNDSVNSFVWTKVGVWLLIAVGLIMTILTKCFQVSHIGHWFKKTIGSLFEKKVRSHTGEKASISQFQALCTALAATVGVGNIAGVAGAIVTGGPGAVFWMWVAAFLGMMTNYSENILGIYYRRKNKSGEWSGGAMYYLQDGLGSKKGMKHVGKILAIIFSIITFGIYHLYWIYQLVKSWNYISESQGRRPGMSPGLVIVLSIVTFGIFNIYYWYRISRQIAELDDRNGEPLEDHSIICLLFSLFGLGIVSAAIVQNTLNFYLDYQM